MLDWQPKAPYTAEQLLEILRILRDPENGCPWDKVQTHASIRKNFLEETCEALEAIDADDPQLMQEELGDVPVTLPALMRAQKLQKRADRCGAEQSAPETARQALRAALDGWNREQDAQAAGELLFAAANAMRLAGVDAEEALTFASKRYCAELLAQKEQSGTQVE